MVRRGKQKKSPFALVPEGEDSVDYSRLGSNETATWQLPDLSISAGYNASRARQLGLPIKDSDIRAPADEYPSDGYDSYETAASVDDTSSEEEGEAADD
ncbi:hypothetical protein AK830_g9709 [Neonectria ditissima]|uniref:Uncharacterized protein n=1 Tax=Neonectria ditissima TaxID=78410 RepID=A0A0P7ARH4_9HYPO|nr:hypothetical protein AK830_g9709 [Neonectria ditissima]